LLLLCSSPSAPSPTCQPPAPPLCSLGAPHALQDILKKYNIPTAVYEKFKDPARAKVGAGSGGSSSMGAHAVIARAAVGVR